MEKQELTAKYSQLHPAGEEKQPGERERGMETSSLQGGSDEGEVVFLQCQEEKKHSFLLNGL